MKQRIIIQALIVSLLITLIVMLLTSKEEPGNPIVTMVTSHGDITIELFQESAPEAVSNFIGLAEGTKEFTDTTGGKVRKPFYDGLVFHRVIDDFMIQGGCPQSTGRGGPGYTFKDEINAEDLGLHQMKMYEGDQLHKSLGIYGPHQIQQMLLKQVFKTLGVTSYEQAQSKNIDLPLELEKLKSSLTLKTLYEGSGYQYDDKLQSHPLNKGFLAMANSGPNTNGSQFFINLTDNHYLDGKHTVFGKVTEGMDIVEQIGKVKTTIRSRPIEPVKIISIRLKK